MAKAKKKRAEKYDPKLKIHGTFEDIIKLSVTNPDKPKEVKNMRTTKEIITAIKNNYFPSVDTTKDLTTTLTFIYSLFPDDPKDDVKKSVLKILGVTISGGLTDQVTIPKNILTKY